MKTENETGTTFKSPSQTNGGVKNGVVPPLMSPEGAKLASASAPGSAKSTTEDKI